MQAQNRSPFISLIFFLFLASHSHLNNAHIREESQSAKSQSLLPNFRRVAAAVDRRRGHQLAVNNNTSSPPRSPSRLLPSLYLYYRYPKTPKIPNLRTTPLPSLSLHTDLLRPRPQRPRRRLLLLSSDGRSTAKSHRRRSCFHFRPCPLPEYNHYSRLLSLAHVSNSNSPPAVAAAAHSPLSFPARSSSKPPLSPRRPAPSPSFLSNNNIIYSLSLRQTGQQREAAAAAHSTHSKQPPPIIYPPSLY